MFCPLFKTSYIWLIVMVFYEVFHPHFLLTIFTLPIITIFKMLVSPVVIVFDVPGVPAAIVSIEAVDLLCKHLSSTTEQVRGNAAIALGYLSYNHQAERQMLNR